MTIRIILEIIFTEVTKKYEDGENILTPYTVLYWFTETTSIDNWQPPP